MVNANKILTVSYGTFSCTLEGFDNPFSTMKSIAEYFRDLAADDRYFGAEPPTPDAEMLHRIAEKEIQRRVEARVEENGVVLTQVEDQSDLPEIEQDASDAVEPEAKAASIEPDSNPATEVPANESVADKLARIRAAVARTHAEQEPLMNAVFSEDEHAEQEPAVANVDEAFADAAPLLEDSLDPDDELSEPEDIEEIDVTGLMENPEANDEEPAEADEGDGQSVATAAVAAAAGVAALALGTNGAAADEDSAESDVAEEVVVEVEAEAEAEAEKATPLEITTPEIAEDTVSEAVAETVEDVVAETTVQEDAVSADEAPSIEDIDLDGAAVDTVEVETETSAETNETVETDIETDTLAAMLEGSDNAAVDDSEVENADAPIDIAAVIAEDADAPVEEVQDGIETVQDSLETEETRVLNEETEETVALSEDYDIDLSIILSEDTAEETANVEAADAKDNAVQSDANELDIEAISAEISDEAEEDAPEMRVRVAKMSRAEFEETFEAIEDDEPFVGEVEIRETLGETGLSNEDEDALIAELAAVERDGQADANLEDALEADIENLDAPVVAQDEKAVFQQLVEESQSEMEPEQAIVAEADDASVDRLMARAETVLEDGEGSRRRATIAHLKAAVAAVRADGESVKREAEAESARTIDQFRDDLAQVVGPTASEEPLVLERPISRPAPVRTKVNPEPDTAEKSENKDRRRARPIPPLMLVSEQRVDQGEVEKPSGPIQPRRVSVNDLDKDDANELFQKTEAPGADSMAGNMFSDSDDFSGFVAEKGAEGIPEMIEASLAYGTYVEGNEVNTRPQIMSRMLSLFPDGSVSREDGLRAFGVLLREGRIVRLNRGQFQLSEQSRFHEGPQDRKANAG